MTEMMLREPTANDAAFVLSTWLNSCRNTKLVNGVPNSLYFSHYGEVIRHILNKSTTVVACSTEDDDLLFGFSVFEMTPTRQVVHYIYVKELYRSLGIGQRLAEVALLGSPGMKVEFSHTSKSGRKFARHYAGARYNPFLLLKGVQE